MNRFSAIPPASFRGRVLLIWPILLGCARLWAGEVAQPPNYNVVVLEGDRGLPHSFVNCLAQTLDGYLWIGTQQGLARYDGTRLVDFDPVTNPELGFDRIEQLFLDDRGTLWIAPLPRGLIAFRDGKFSDWWSRDEPLPRVMRFLGNTSNQWFFVTFERALLRGTLSGKPDMAWQQLKPSGSKVNDYAMNSGGEVLACIDDGGLAKLDGEQFVTIKPGGELAGAGMNCLASDSQGQIWVGTSMGLACYTNEEIRLAVSSDASDQSAVLEIVPSRDGSLWVHSPNRLRRFRDGAWQADIDNWSKSISTPWEKTISFGDGKGGLWIRDDPGTGIMHIFQDGRLEHLTQKTGLPDGSATLLMEVKKTLNSGCNSSWIWPLK